MTTPLPSADAEASTMLPRDAWVEMKLVQIFMRHALPALHAAVVVTAVVIGVLASHVETAALGTWAAAMVALIAFRYWAICHYHVAMKGVSGPKLHAFMARHVWAWALTGMVWGAMLWVFFLKAPLYQQFVCMTVLVAVPGFAVGTFSSYARCFRAYVDGLMLMVFITLVYFLLNPEGVPSTVANWGMLILAAVYWIVIRAAGFRICGVQRANLELQFDNNALVASLTRKSEAAIEAISVKNRFIASAAHDLRQPVHALALYASWLAAEPALVQDITPKITQSARVVNDLFNSLFEFAGLENQTLRARVQSVDLQALIEDIEIQYAPVAHERQLRLRIRAPAATAQSDPILLKRIIGNLVSNALKNTQKGGVLIAARRRAGVWGIEVWDTGPGIAQEHQEAIFQEFYRVPHAGTHEGFGLGLAIVSRISHVLGHRVTLRSQLGRGSVFRLELTRQKPLAATASRQDSTR
jgi:signal transduction histidine kinase